MSEIHDTLAMSIIKQQEAIIGPIAWSEARKVSGLNFDSNGKLMISGDGKQVLEQLVKRYENLFGQTSIEVCKQAAKSFILTVNKEEIPQILL